jgi:hypothetical protein
MPVDPPTIEKVYEIKIPRDVRSRHDGYRYDVQIVQQVVTDEWVPQNKTSLGRRNPYLPQLPVYLRFGFQRSGIMQFQVMRHL